MLLVRQGVDHWHRRSGRELIDLGLQAGADGERIEVAREHQVDAKLLPGDPAAEKQIPARRSPNPGWRPRRRCTRAIRESLSELASPPLAPASSRCDASVAKRDTRRTLELVVVVFSWWQRFCFRSRRLSR